MNQEVHFNVDFTRKYILPAMGFEPMTFWLLTYCLGYAFFAGICISSIVHFVPIGGTMELTLQWLFFLL